MFTPDTMIDAVQNGKKTFVKTFVQNEVVAGAMNDFVDQQTSYTKTAMAATLDMMTTVSQETVKAFQNLSKFDYVKFGEGVMKTFTAPTTVKAK